jgi:hypothetical protein
MPTLMGAAIPLEVTSSDFECRHPIRFIIKVAVSVAMVMLP